MKRKKFISTILVIAILASMPTNTLAATVSTSDMVSNTNVVSETDTSPKSDVETIKESFDEAIQTAGVDISYEYDPSATSGKCGDNLTWSFDKETGVLTISGDGDMWSANEFDRWTPWLVKSVKFDGEITSIGEEAFSGCHSLTSITIPNTVTSIGDSAFYCCDSLPNIIIPDSVKSIDYHAFGGCESLTNIEIPGSVISIGKDIFCLCENLTNIQVASENRYYASKDGVLFTKNFSTLICWPAGKSGDYIIPNSVAYIYDSAFTYSWNLTSVVIPDSVTYIGEEAFYDCRNLTTVTILNSDCVIYDNSNTFDAPIIKGYKDSTAEEYANAYNYTFIDVENPFISGKCGDNLTWTLDADTGTLTISGNGAMRDFTLYDDRDDGYYLLPWHDYRRIIKNIVFNGIITSIGKEAFINCDNLTSIKIPDSVTSIGDNAFSHCYNLLSVDIPSSVKSIGEYAFYSCGNLKSINVDKNNKNYSSEDGVLFNKLMTELILCPSKMATDEYNIPTTVIYIDDYAFYGHNIDNIVIPNSVISIGNRAFYLDYEEISSVEIGNSVTTIGNYAFAGLICDYVIIPKSVTRIGISAFSGEIKHIYYEGSEDDWSNIDTIDEDGEIINFGNFRDYLNGATIHYNYTNTSEMIVPVELNLVGAVSSDNSANISFKSADGTTVSGEISEGKAEIAIVEGETYTITISKPGFTSYTVKNFVACQDELSDNIEMYAGDVNGDDIINAKDRAIMSAVFGTRKSDNDFSDVSDFNGDNIINAKDVAVLSSNFTKRGIEIKL